MKGQIRCHAARSPEDVFDFLADLRNEIHWNPRVVSIELVTPGEVGSGSTFHGVYRGLGSLDTVLQECHRPSRLTFRSDGPRAHLEGEFALAPSGSGTDVALDADFQPRGAMRLLAPLMAPVLRRQNAAAAHRLKAALDGHAP